MKRNKLERFLAVGLSIMVFLGGIQLTSKTVEASSWSRLKTASGYLKVTEGVTATASTQQSEGTSGDGGAVALVDGDPMTRYHSRYSGSPQPTYNSTDDEITANNEIELTLSEAKTLRGITYLPRQDARGNGVFKKFKVYVKLDGEADYSTDPVATVDWSDAWPSGNWSATNAPDEKEVTFDSVQDNVKQVKIVVTKTDAYGQANGCIAGAEMGLVLNQMATGAEVTALVREGYEGGTVTGGGVTSIGETATLTATPNEGYRFLHWVTVDGNVETIVSRDASMTTRQITESDTNLTYYAKFQKKLENTTGTTSTTNVALGKTVTASENCSNLDLSGITDGSKGDFVEYYFGNGNGEGNTNDISGAGYIQVDLGAKYTNLDCVKLKRFSGNVWSQGTTRKYGSTIIALSEDEYFTNPTIIFNSNKIVQDGDTKKGVNADGSLFTWTDADLELFSGFGSAGSEDRYVENNYSDGREFTIPYGTVARYVRVYTAGRYTQDEAWGKLVTQHVYELEVFASNIVPVDTITATAGTQQSNNIEGDGSASGVLDGNQGTAWHSAYNQNSNTYKNWIDFKFDTPRVINGLTVQSRNNANGKITEYQVWISDKEGNLKTLNDTMSGETYTSTWQSEFTQVCSGTWSGDYDSVKTITFPEVTATHVRLVAKESGNGYAYVKEMRALTPLDSSEKQIFLGSALRMDSAQNYEQTSLRFMYEVPTEWNGWNLDNTNLWGWKYSTNAENLNSASVTKVGEGKYTLDDSKGVYKSNLVFTNIARENYGRSIYAQLVVNYQNGNDTLAIYTPVAERSTYFVADAIVKAYSEEPSKQAQVKYAKGIMGSVSAQLALGVNDFSGEKVNIANGLYTFNNVSTGTDTDTQVEYVQCDISAKTAKGTKVYLNLADGSKPNASTSHNIKIRVKNNGFSLYDLDESPNRYLHFFESGNNIYTYDRCQTDDNSHEFALYKPSASAPEDSLIKGYEKVTSLSDIQEGSKYLIVKEITVGNVTTCYIMNPYSGGSNYNYVAKVVSND